MIELDELKAHIGSAEVAGHPDVDTVLAALEERAVAFLEGATERHFGASKTFTLYFDGTGSGTLWLPEKPAAITSVHEREAVGDAWDEIVGADADGFELRGARLLRKGDEVWERGHEYRVMFDFGYTAGQEPDDIRGLVKDLVALAWRRRGVEGFASGNIGDFTFSTAATRPWTPSDLDTIPLAREIIDNWRWVGVGAA